jgi:hypothetical protein
MSCQPDCRTPAPTQAHCGSCHATFGGVYGFDRHRRDGHCVAPETVGMKLRDGVWRMPISQADHDRLTAMRRRP